MNFMHQKFDVTCTRVRERMDTCGKSLRAAPSRMFGIVRLKRDGTRAETKFRLSPKRTSPFKSAGASVQSTAGSRGVRISLSNLI